MPTLHLVRQSGFTSDDFAQCLQTLSNEDVIVFLDDGCYNIKHALMNRIGANKNIKLKIIDQHASARGIHVVSNACEKITMENLVELTLTNDRVITWQ